MEGRKERRTEGKKEGKKEGLESDWIIYELEAGLGPKKYGRYDSKLMS